MAALVERKAVEFVAQRQAAQIPSMCGQCTAMQEKQWPRFLVAPIEIAEAQVSDLNSSVARQDNIIEAEPGAHGRRLEVVLVFVGG
jgi:hypothetical protein